MYDGGRGGGGGVGNKLPFVMAGQRRVGRVQEFMCKMLRRLGDDVVILKHES